MQTDKLEDICRDALTDALGSLVDTGETLDVTIMPLPAKEAITSALGHIATDGVRVYNRERGKNCSDDLLDCAVTALTAVYALTRGTDGADDFYEWADVEREADGENWPPSLHTTWTAFVFELGRRLDAAFESGDDPILAHDEAVALFDYALDDIDCVASSVKSVFVRLAYAEDAEPEDYADIDVSACDDWSALETVLRATATDRWAMSFPDVIEHPWTPCTTEIEVVVTYGDVSISRGHHVADASGRIDPTKS